jgi:hypothetical protein
MIASEPSVPYIIAVDKAWLHHSKPEFKTQSMKWQQNMHHHLETNHDHYYGMGNL